jgi:hypothetical protein
VDDARKAVLEEIEVLLEAAKTLRRDLRAKEASYRRMARRVEQGVDIGTAMGSLGAHVQRQELTDTLDEFEHRRHRTRLAITAAALEEGMTIGDVGRAWGFSRQLAARYAKEARESR